MGVDILIPAHAAAGLILSVEAAGARFPSSNELILSTPAHSPFIFGDLVRGRSQQEARGALVSK